MRLTHRDEYCRWCSDGSKASLQLGYEDYPSILRGDAVDKLAAYEDTGLSPEEFKEKSESVLELYGKLKPYADAEEEGRLVILPCKVGDALFVTNEGTPLPAVRMVESVTWWNGKISIFAVNKLTGSAYHCHVEDFGKTVFLTREEAKAAMKGERD